MPRFEWIGNMTQSHSDARVMVLENSALIAKDETRRSGSAVEPDITNIGKRLKEVQNSEVRLKSAT